MPSEPLTDAEIAELRQIQSKAVGSVVREGDAVARLVLTQEQATYFLAMAKSVPRLLDEVKRLRELADDVALLTLDVRDPKRTAALERLKQRVLDRL